MRSSSNLCFSVRAPTVIPGSHMAADGAVAAAVAHNVPAAVTGGVGAVTGGGARMAGGGEALSISRRGSLVQLVGRTSTYPMYTASGLGTAASAGDGGAYSPGDRARAAATQSPDPNRSKSYSGGPWSFSGGLRPMVSVGAGSMVVGPAPAGPQASGELKGPPGESNGPHGELNGPHGELNGPEGERLLTQRQLDHRSVSMAPACPLPSRPTTPQPPQLNQPIPQPLSEAAACAACGGEGSTHDPTCATCDEVSNKSTTLTLEWLSRPQTVLVVCKLSPYVYPMLNHVLRWLRDHGLEVFVEPAAFKHVEPSLKGCDPGAQTQAGAGQLSGGEAQSDMQGPQSDAGGLLSGGAGSTSGVKDGEGGGGQHISPDPLAGPSVGGGAAGGGSSVPAGGGSSTGAGSGEKGGGAGAGEGSTMDGDGGDLLCPDGSMPMAVPGWGPPGQDGQQVLACAIRSRGSLKTRNSQNASDKAIISHQPSGERGGAQGEREQGGGVHEGMGDDGGGGGVGTGLVAAVGGGGEGGSVTEEGSEEQWGVLTWAEARCCGHSIPDEVVRVLDLVVVLGGGWWCFIHSCTCSGACVPHLALCLAALQPCCLYSYLLSLSPCLLPFLLPCLLPCVLPLARTW